MFKAGPWSQAPVFLQQLRLLEGFDLAGMGQNSAEYIHTITECAKLAFADREAWYGDPDFTDVPLEMLLSRDYAEERRALLDRRSRRASCGPAATTRASPTPVGDAPLAPGVGEPTRGDTVHLDVVDRWGNMVAATPSGGWLWGAPVIPSLGFSLGTRAQMFWLEDGLPNSLAPGKRPRTTLSPTMAARGGEPYLAFGTPGGDQQDQWTLHVFLGHVHFGLDLQAAIDAPNHHTEAFPSSFYPRETAAAARRGRGARRRGDDRRACANAGTRSRSRPRGASAASAQSRASRTACSRPAQTRAASRVTRSDARRRVIRLVDDVAGNCECRVLTWNHVVRRHVASAQSSSVVDGYWPSPRIHCRPEAEDGGSTTSTCRLRLRSRPARRSRSSSIGRPTAEATSTGADRRITPDSM